MSDVPETADVIIVRGGSAGAVLAARLSQDSARTVLRSSARLRSRRVPARAARHEHDREPATTGATLPVAAAWPVPHAAPPSSAAVPVDPRSRCRVPVSPRRARPRGLVLPPPAAFRLPPHWRPATADAGRVDITAHHQPAASHRQTRRRRQLGFHRPATRALLTRRVPAARHQQCPALPRGARLQPRRPEPPTDTARSTCGWRSSRRRSVLQTTLTEPQRVGRPMDASAATSRDAGAVRGRPPGVLAARDGAVFAGSRGTVRRHLRSPARSGLARRRSAALGCPTPVSSVLTPRSTPTAVPGFLACRSGGPVPRSERPEPPPSCPRHRGRPDGRVLRRSVGELEHRLVRADRPEPGKRHRAQRAAYDAG